jgi:SAM-dependent methyltransferase
MSGAPFHEAMWSRRYRDAGNDYLFGTAPNKYLARHVDLLSGCRDVLCVADGEGRNSVWLAQQGFEVTANEISAVAREKAGKLASGRGVCVRFEQADILSGPWPTAAFDALIAIFIQFAGPAERESLFDGMKQAVRPGGMILVQGYTPKQLEYRTGGPSAIENLYTEALVRRYFADWDLLRVDEYEDDLAEGSGHYGRSALLGVVARRPAA